VGIGTVTPTEKLDVTGNGRFSGMLTADTVVANTEFRGPGIIKQIMSVSPTDNVFINGPGARNWQTLNGMTMNITTGRSILLILVDAGIYTFSFDGNPVQANLRIIVDGAQVGTYTSGAFHWEDNVPPLGPYPAGGDPNQATTDAMSLHAFTAVNPGNHTVTVQWKISATIPVSDGQAMSYPSDPNGYDRIMTVLEISRL
jgi:hypothetical protein